MKITARAGSALVLAAIIQSAVAIELNVSNIASIQNATSIVAYGLMKYYTGNITNTPSTIAVLPAPYYWWEAGAMWGAMLDYYHYTNDSTYNDVTYQALVSQVGPLYDYMVPAHQKDEGNDDQAFWGFATMSAAERGFTAPPSGTPSWLQLTINLWNTQAARWNITSCGGGLKWQIFDSNNGYDYKNSVSNGAFFQLSARLARYTGNSTYVDWATKTWDWSRAIGLIDGNYNVFDGTDDLKNCSQISAMQWSYSVGIYLYGAAVLYNYTNGSTVWAERTQGLLKATAPFLSPFDNATNIMYEQACETIGTCNYDQWSFKAYLARFMWATTQMASFTYPTVSTLLTTSAQAAAGSCSGGSNRTVCGAKWYVGGWDGGAGVGQQLSALEVMQGLLINGTQPPYTSGDVHLAAPPSNVSTAPIPSTTSSVLSAAAPILSTTSSVLSATAPILSHTSSVPSATALISSTTKPVASTTSKPLLTSSGKRSRDARRAAAAAVAAALAMGAWLYIDGGF